MTQQEKRNRITELTALLSQAARAYEQEDREIISNFEYDRLYDELKSLEDETGIILANSPTQKVGYEVLSELPKERHESPMLSLNKTKSREELAEWLGEHDGLLSWKLDGLTIVLTYRNGSLYKAVTRGNGEVGEVITNNAKVFKNIPLAIPYTGELVIRGEAIIKYSDFKRINDSIPDVDAKYKNPRNLCSGSVRQLDNSITAARSVFFYAFSLISADESTVLNFNNHSQQLDYLETLGFDVVERKLVNATNVADTITWFADKISFNDFPSDGLVLFFDNIAYGESLGRTAKFPRNGIAFKWADETATTTLREIEWSASRTGLLNPVAIFDPVELEGTTVSRASLHNISIMKDLKIGIGDSVTVYKANMIIPQIADNLTQSGVYNIINNSSVDSVSPNDETFKNTLHKLIEIKDNNTLLAFNYNGLIAEYCPICAMPTKIHSENDCLTLYCENPDCTAKKFKLLAHMAERDALNIDGLSESTIEKLVSIGLVHNALDLFRLKGHEEAISSLEGFGEKSCANLLSAIDNARNTTLDRVIYSLGIPNIGLTNARLIAKFADEDPERVILLSFEELISIPQIGEVLANSYVEYFSDDSKIKSFRELINELNLEKVAPAGSGLDGLIFVITGSVEHFANRNELKAFIEGKGGKVTGSVTKNTSYLINNDSTSNSTKNKTAKTLGVEIITEVEFLERFNA